MPLPLPDEVAATDGFHHRHLTFRALYSRNYRLFFCGQAISLIGTWMQRVAMSWLVYRLTDSEFLLGLAGFLGLFPVFVLSPLAGVWADRTNRLRLLLLTQTLAMLQALILALLVITDRIQVIHIMFLATGLGLINAFDTPIRQAFTVEMVDDKADLANAIALNSAMFNGARLVGPSIAGLVVAALGEHACFLLNALSYLAVIAALLAMNTVPRSRGGGESGLLTRLWEGFRYVTGPGPIRLVLVFLVLASLAGMPYQTLMPVLAKDVLHGGARTLGFLMGAAGAGALAGAIFLASRRDLASLRRIIPAALALFGLGLVGLAVSSQLWLSLAVLVLTGLGMMLHLSASNTLIQSVVDDDKRGRVMSFYVMSVMGTVPIGSLLAGWAADYWGTPPVILCGGVCCLVGAGFLARILPRHFNQPA